MQWHLVNIISLTLSVPEYKLSGKRRMPTTNLPSAHVTAVSADDPYPSIFVVYAFLPST
jgi:hypothetical protein